MRILYAFIVLFFMNPASAYVISAREIRLSKIAASVFQDKITSGEIADLYNDNFDAEIKKSVTHKEFNKFINKIKNALGLRKNSILFNCKKINNHLIRVSFMSEFDKGVSVESYCISIAVDGSCFLFRYEITDSSKFIF